jgi:ABC-type sugar transport system, permease component
MNASNVQGGSKILKESKNKIRIEFDRTSKWTRFKIKYLSWSFVGQLVFKLFRLILLLGISYVILLPFFSKVTSSFMSREDFVDVTVKLIPKNPTLDTYKAILEESGYFTALLNTFILSAGCGLIQTLICSAVGYGFAKYKFKGSKLLFILVIFTMVVPHETLQLSLFMKFRYFDILGLFNLLGGGLVQSLRVIGFTSLNLNNSYWPLFLLSLAGLGFKNGLYILVMRQFFRGVPDELEESAYIDGSGVLKTFFSIILPLSVPMMITIFLLTFSWQWTDNFYTEIFFTTTGMKLMPDIIMTPKQLDTNYAGQNLYISAIRNTCGLMIIAPLIVVYIFCQRYLVQGIERSGIVG